jgi:hypothetical protein
MWNNFYNTSYCGGGMIARNKRFNVHSFIERFDMKKDSMSNSEIRDGFQALINAGVDKMLGTHYLDISNKLVSHGYCKRPLKTDLSIANVCTGKDF